MSKFEEVKGFVLAWEAGKTLEDVASVTGKSKAACQQMARSLRKKGVGLKTYGSSTGSLTDAQYAQLSDMIKTQPQLPGMGHQVRQTTSKEKEA